MKKPGNKIVRVSPMIKSKPEADGSGFIGFTVQFSDWEIENHLHVYNSHNRNDILHKSRMEYQKYLSKIKPNKE